jgi:ABC-2 type transport system permease protein
MSATTLTADVALAPRSLDRPSLSRLTAVELRKMTDTRAGFWLQLAVVALTVVVIAVDVLFGNTEDQRLREVLSLAVAPASILLPIVGILLVTSEWSQRTAMITFALVPRRPRVLAAKLLRASCCRSSRWRCASSSPSSAPRSPRPGSSTRGRCPSACSASTSSRWRQG